MKQEYYYLCDRQFDKEFDKIALLERYPWVGRDFAKSSCRPLILGDSHYATDGKNHSSEKTEEALEWFKDKEATRIVVNGIIKDKCNEATTYRMYEKMLETFIDISPENIKSFWKRVTFYNFIQRVMERSDEKTSDDDVADGWRCLAGVIEVLHPTSILIFGARNDRCSDKINRKDIRLEDFDDDKNPVNGCKPRIGKIVFGDEIIPITLIQHPSQRFNTYKCEPWREYLEERDPKMMDYLLR